MHASRHLRVLHVFDQYRVGGFETHLSTLLRFLPNAGITSWAIGGHGFETAAARCHVREFEPIDLNPFYAETVLEASQLISHRIRRSNIDCVHLQPFLSYVPGALAALATGTPYVVTFHGSPDLSSYARHFGTFLLTCTRELVIPSAGCVTAVSEYARDAVTAAFGRVARFEVVRNPLDFSENPLADRRFTPADFVAGSAGTNEECEIAGQHSALD